MSAVEKELSAAVKRASIFETEIDMLRPKLDAANRRVAELDVELLQLKHGLTQDAATAKESAPAQSNDVVDAHGEAPKKNQKATAQPVAKPH